MDLTTGELVDYGITNRATVWGGRGGLGFVVQHHDGELVGVGTGADEVWRFSTPQDTRTPWPVAIFGDGTAVILGCESDVECFYRAIEPNGDIRWEVAQLPTEHPMTFTPDRLPGVGGVWVAPGVLADVSGDDGPSWRWYDPQTGDAQELQVAERGFAGPDYFAMLAREEGECSVRVIGTAGEDIAHYDWRWPPTMWSPQAHGRSS